MRTNQIEIIQNQINYLVDIGFPKLVKFSTQEYLNSFSLIGEPTVPEYRNRFDFPVTVDPRIPFSGLISKSNIDNYLKISDIANISGDLSNPYIFYTHDSKRYSSHSAETAISKFDPDEEGCTLQELIFFYLYYPYLFAGIVIDAILTDFRPADHYHPCILKVNEKAEIGAHWHNDFSPGINILSKGKLIYKYNARLNP